MTRKYKKKSAPAAMVRAVDAGIPPRAVSPFLKLAIATSSLSLSLALAGAGCAHTTEDAQMKPDAIQSRTAALGASATGSATAPVASATAIASVTATATATTPIAPDVNHGRTAGVPAGTAPPTLPTAHPPPIRGKIAMPQPVAPTPSSAPKK
jgi:hypothetical protein